MKGTKIAVFFGGKVTKHLGLIKRAAKDLGIHLDLISYNRVCFGTGEGRVKIRKSQITNHKFSARGGLRFASQTNSKFKIQNLKQDNNWIGLSDYDVVFFRTTGKHWEEVDLIIDQISKIKNQNKKPVVVDPMVEKGKPSYACKAWQMLKLREAGIAVPKTIYGSLWFLYETMKNSNFQFSIFKRNLIAEFKFPIIIKGSGGDRGTRVFKADNLEQLEKLVRELRKSETEEGKRYMLQEYIENDGDYRVLVLGEKVLGVMKRSAKKGSGEFRNNFSMGGKVEIADLPEEVKKMAVEAARVCGLWVAGVDIIMQKSKIKNQNLNEYLVLEVNKGPQFKGFMEATGIDVPQEIVKFLANLTISNSNNQITKSKQ